MVRHTKSIRRAQLEAENEMLKKQLQEREPQAKNELSILKRQQQEKEPQVDNETLIR